MRFLLSAKINEDIKSGKDLFTQLKLRGEISPTNIDHLAELLEEIHRKDLQMKVLDFQKTQPCQCKWYQVQSSICLGRISTFFLEGGGGGGSTFYSI